MKNATIIRQTIYVDESGTLPDPKDKIIILAAVSSSSPEQILKIFKKVRQGLIYSGKQTSLLSEIKFYRSGEQTKFNFFKKLAVAAVDIFVLIVDKKGQRIADSPTNYAALAYALLEECFIFYQAEDKRIIFDKHFNQKKDRDEFNAILTALLGGKILIEHVDSYKHQEVNVADMVAGSALWAYSGKNNQFYQIIKDHFIVEKILNWKEAKNKLIKKIKNSREPA